MGATERSIHLFVLRRGTRTLRMRHPSEAAYYVVDGSARVEDYDSGESWTLGPGAMFHVDPDTTYGIHAAADGTTVLGGPCPPDPALYASDLVDAEPRGA
jgi:quercetin dioxygenase-like cupin family protein